MTEDQEDADNLGKIPALLSAVPEGLPDITSLPGEQLLQNN